MLRREQDQDLRASVVFDRYFLESSLYESGAVEQTVSALKEAGHTFEEEDALWLRTTDFGDDKDRVMRKREGGYTYFVPDVAYHHDKWQRGFTRVINEQGADHHSTITRVRAGLQGLDVRIPEGWPEYVLHQMVTVMREGAEVKLSKRAGSYVTLRDLIDWVGCDASLFSGCPRTHLAAHLDVDLPWPAATRIRHYIQYAHARCASVLRKARNRDSHDVDDGPQHLDELNETETLALVVSLHATLRWLQRPQSDLSLATSPIIRELAADFHSFYNAHKILEGAREVMNARLAPVTATRQVLASGLDLLGVSAPDSKCLSKLARGADDPPQRGVNPLPSKAHLPRLAELICKVSPRAASSA